MSKDRSWWTFSEKISKLIAGVNFQQMNAVRVHVFPEPVILDGIVLGAGSHALEFQAGEGESTHIVFMNSDMHVGHCRQLKTTSGAEGMDEFHNGLKVFARSTQSNIFRLHG